MELEEVGVDAEAEGDGADDDDALAGRDQAVLEQDALHVSDQRVSIVGHRAEEGRNAPPHKSGSRCGSASISLRAHVSWALPPGYRCR